MKTYCKNVDITDFDTIRPHVKDYLKGDSKRPAKWKRHDYQKMLSRMTNYTIDEIIDAVINIVEEKLNVMIDSLTEEVIHQFKSEEFTVEKIHYFKMRDGLSGKEREIVHESPLQQTMEFVIVSVLKPLFKAKIRPFQFASIRNRGQVKGKAQIEKWIRRDKDCRYFVKLDIIKCFQSIKVTVIDAFLVRDLNKNRFLEETIIRCIRTYERFDKCGELIADGLAIGTPIAQWICNYLMSYVSRFIDTLTYIRRKIKRRKVKHQLFYMDDIFLTGPNLKQLESAVKEIEMFLYNKLGLKIHEWKIFKVKEHAIDMMGYKIYYDRTEIRPRIFLRARKQVLRCYRELRRLTFVSFQRSKKLIPYIGYFKYTDSENFNRKYHLNYICNKAKQTQSHYAKKGALLV